MRFQPGDRVRVYSKFSAELGRYGFVEKVVDDHIGVLDDWVVVLLDDRRYVWFRGSAIDFAYPFPWREAEAI